MTWSVATPRWVIPWDRSETTDQITPRVAAISWPSTAALAGRPKNWRNSS